MIRINLLLPDEQKTSRRLKLPPVNGLVAIGLFLLALLPIGTTVYRQESKLSMLRSAVAEAQEETAKLRPVVDRVHKLNSQSQDLAVRLRAVRQLDGRRTFHIGMLDALSELLPKHMWLTDFEEKPDGRATIEGGTFSNLVVAELMVRLDDSDYFDNVRLVQAERREVGDRPVVHFEIDARLAYPQKGTVQ